VEIQPKQPTAQGPAENFIGDVWFDVIAAGVPPSRLRVSTVRFSPGAHTAWHRHANGQTLHITEGRGFVQARGGPAARSSSDPPHKPADLAPSGRLRRRQPITAARWFHTSVAAPGRRWLGATGRNRDHCNRRGTRLNHDDSC
jgi:hypothetical protein